MKNRLFFSSFIITAILLTNVNFSFADGNDVLSSEDMTFSIPSLTSIEIDSSSVFNSSATMTNNTSVTLSTPLIVKFNVSTLDPDGVQVALQGTAPVDTNSIIRFEPSDGIVFTKSDGSATYSAASNALFFQNASSNRNTIVFPASCTSADGSIVLEDVADRGSSSEMSAMLYNVTGEKEISCTISGDSKNGTFGMNDETGNYTATLTLTQIINTGESVCVGKC